MNGTILWRELIARKRLRSGKMRRIFYTFAIGFHWEDRLSAEQVCHTSYMILSFSYLYPEIITSHIWISLLSLAYTYDICCINLLYAVRGMMYYRRALKLQAFLDMADEEGRITLFFIASVLVVALWEHAVFRSINSYLLVFTIYLFFESWRF